VPIGIVVCSDRAAAGLYEDRGEPAIKAYLGVALATLWRLVLTIVKDDRVLIATEIAPLADIEQCPLILTTGGAGPAPRDVTPRSDARRLRQAPARFRRPCVRPVSRMYRRPFYRGSSPQHEANR
jgi:molybdopterin biosynthesis enzyme MoaB